MTDCILFATIFATFAVLSHSYAGGPTGKDIFELDYVLVETFCLLLSSVTYGFAMVSMYKGNQRGVMLWLAITFLFGAGFIAMKINEFTHLIHEGFDPRITSYNVCYTKLLRLLIVYVFQVNINVLENVIFAAVLTFLALSLIIRFRNNFV